MVPSGTLASALQLHRSLLGESSSLLTVEVISESPKPGSGEVLGSIEKSWLRH